GIYNLGSLFLTWEEIVAKIIELTHSASAVRFIPSDRWQGPAFLNEVWDLSRAKAEQKLGFTPQKSAEEVRNEFANALRACIAQVRPS
ncbi:MAG TPA: hypothetical protein VN203_05420, partial [Candidatus Acidoferrum sp.]|nr:hypothetical protein [Candidatus Acidoferrum sp.]